MTSTLAVALLQLRDALADLGARLVDAAIDGAGDEVGEGLVRHCHFRVPKWLLSGGVGQSWEWLTQVRPLESWKYDAVGKPLARLARAGTFRLAAVNRFGKAVVVDDTLIGQEGDTLVFVAATDALDELGAHIERGGEA